MLEASLTVLPVDSSQVYQRVALYFNDTENYRTETEYSDSLIIKTICFQFVNSYGSIIYLAFVAKYDVLNRGDQCYLGNCMIDLDLQVGTIMTLHMVLHVVLEFYLPARSMKSGVKNRAKKSTTDLLYTEEELQYLAKPFPGTLYDFSEPGKTLIQEYSHRLNHPQMEWHVDVRTFQI